MYILSDTEEILVLIVGLSLVIGLLIKSYRDYKSMTNEYNIKMRKKENDEKYVKNLIKEIKEIIVDNKIMGIVVGNPINLDGSISKSSQSASDFCKNLSKNLTIPITMWDERLSSEATFKITKDLGTNTSNRVKNLDKNAAAYILQGAIDYLSN